MKVLLQKLGFPRVDFASNGIEAVKSARVGKYDLILMNVQMPLMDGYEATQTIRQSEEKEHVPIIAVTTQVTEASMARCERVGMDGFLGKPLTIDLLKATLEPWLSESVLPFPRGRKAASGHSSTVPP